MKTIIFVSALFVCSIGFVKAEEIASSEECLDTRAYFCFFSFSNRNTGEVYKRHYGHVKCSEPPIENRDIVLHVDEKNRTYLADFFLSWSQEKQNEFRLDFFRDQEVLGSVFLQEGKRISFFEEGMTANVGCTITSR